MIINEGLMTEEEKGRITKKHKKRKVNKRKIMKKEWKNEERIDQFSFF